MQKMLFVILFALLPFSEAAAFDRAAVAFLPLPEKILTSIPEEPRTARIPQPRPEPSLDALCGNGSPKETAGWRTLSLDCTRRPPYPLDSTRTMIVCPTIGAIHALFNGTATKEGTPAFATACFVEKEDPEERVSPFWEHLDPITVGSHTFQLFAACPFVNESEQRLAYAILLREMQELPEYLEEAQFNPLLRFSVRAELNADTFMYDCSGEFAAPSNVEDREA